MISREEGIDHFIASLKFPKLAAYVVPRISREFCMNRAEAEYEWMMHLKRRGA